MNLRSYRYVLSRKSMDSDDKQKTRREGTTIPRWLSKDAVAIQMYTYHRAMTNPSLSHVTSDYIGKW
jgi:hypothetical protein